MLHEEKTYPPVVPHAPLNMLEAMAGKCAIEGEAGVLEFSVTGRQFSGNIFSIIADWDFDQDNLAEEQNRKLNHSLLRGASDPNTKPNLEQKEQLDRLINAPSNQLNSNEKDLLYMFRFTLTENKKALIKYLGSIDWDVEKEVTELPSLLELWNKKAPIEVADALKLLGRERMFQNPLVRAFAVDVLRAATDEELQQFLLQLVQALKYEPVTAPPSSSSSASVGGSVPGTPGSSSVASSVSNTPITPQRPLSNKYGGGGAMVMGSNDLNSAFDMTLSPSTAAAVAGSQALALANASAVAGSADEARKSPLASFLIERACESPKVANYLYWFLKVETSAEDEIRHLLFESVFNALKSALMKSSPKGRTLCLQLQAVEAYFMAIAACQVNYFKCYHLILV